MDLQVKKKKRLTGVLGQGDTQALPHRWWITLAAFLVGAILGPAVLFRFVQDGFAKANFSCDPDGMQSSGAIYRICMPQAGTWNGDLLLFAHGYVAETEPVAIPEGQLQVGGSSIPEIVTGLGFAFATTSYSTNGLAVVPGMADLIDLVGIFSQTYGAPGHVFLVGASEGGIITALAVERNPEVFSGGLAACGPIGDFGSQIEYFGDFRVIFDYFFPGLIPGSPIDIPPWLMDDWENYYTSTIRPVIEDPLNGNRIEQLLRITGAPYNPGDPGTREETIRGLLWYNVFATNNGIAVLGGQPYDNQGRVYRGSDDDILLNQSVQRFSADPVALSELEVNYQTAGDLPVPVVTIHTTGDPIIPYWHELLYRVKVIHNDATAIHRNIPVDRYGHCIFQADEVLGAFLQLVDLVVNPPEPVPSQRAYLPLFPGFNP